MVVMIEYPVVSDVDLEMGRQKGGDWVRWGFVKDVS